MACYSVSTGSDFHRRVAPPVADRLSAQATRRGRPGKASRVMKHPSACPTESPAPFLISRLPQRAAPKPSAIASRTFALA